MTAIALAVFTLFIAYVMVWSIKNDNVRSIGEQTGWIRMRHPRGTDRKAKGKTAGTADAAPRQGSLQAPHQSPGRFR
jgi:hypothetical protein